MAGLLSAHEWKSGPEDEVGRRLGKKVERDIKAGAVCVEAERPCGPRATAASCPYMYAYTCTCTCTCTCPVLPIRTYYAYVKYTYALSGQVDLRYWYGGCRDTQIELVEQKPRTS